MVIQYCHDIVSSFSMLINCGQSFKNQIDSISISKEKKKKKLRWGHTLLIIFIRFRVVRMISQHDIKILLNQRICFFFPIYNTFRGSSLHFY
jgi:hypothetical protein